MCVCSDSFTLPYLSTVWCLQHIAVAASVWHRHQRLKHALGFPPARVRHWLANRARVGVPAEAGYRPFLQASLAQSPSCIVYNTCKLAVALWMFGRVPGDGKHWRGRMGRTAQNRPALPARRRSQGASRRRRQSGASRRRRQSGASSRRRKGPQDARHGMAKGVRAPTRRARSSNSRSRWLQQAVDAQPQRAKPLPKPKLPAFSAERRLRRRRARSILGGQRQRRPPSGQKLASSTVSPFSPTKAIQRAGQLLGLAGLTNLAPQLSAVQAELLESPLFRLYLWPRRLVKKGGEWVDASASARPMRLEHENARSSALTKPNTWWTRALLRGYRVHLRSTSQTVCDRNRSRSWHLCWF